MHKIETVDIDDNIGHMHIGPITSYLEFYVDTKDGKNNKGVFDVILLVSNEKRDCASIKFEDCLDLKKIMPRRLEISASSLLDDDETESVSEALAQLVLKKVTSSLEIYRKFHDPSDETLIFDLKIGSFVCQKEIEKEKVSFMFE